MNRVTNPLRRVNAPEAQALKRNLGAVENAILGDGSGRVAVEANAALNYSLVYIRFRKNADTNGSAGFDIPMRARVEGAVPLTAGVPVRVAVDKVSGEYVVQGVAYEEATRRGINTAQTFNPLKSASQDPLISDIRNLRLFFPLNSLKASVEPYLYIYNGQLKNAVKGQSDNIDFTSHVPAVGFERLVGAALLPETNAIELVPGTTRTLDGAPFTISDLQELVDGFSIGAIPMQAVHVIGGATGLTNTDILFDLRNVFMSDTNRGTGAYPNPVTDRLFIAIADGYTQIVQAPLKLNAGATVKLGAGSVLVALPPRDGANGTIVRESATKTADYTITSTDSIIYADASSAPITITLPPAGGVAGYQFDIKAIDVTGGAVTVDGNGSETIDGQLTQTLNTQYDSVTVASDGTEWFIL